jgi:hypothetical protein
MRVQITFTRLWRAAQSLQCDSQSRSNRTAIVRCHSVVAHTASSTTSTAPLTSAEGRRETLRAPASWLARRMIGAPAERLCSRRRLASGPHRTFRTIGTVVCRSGDDEASLAGPCRQPLLPPGPPHPRERHRNCCQSDHPHVAAPPVQETYIRSEAAAIASPPEREIPRVLGSGQLRGKAHRRGSFPQRRVPSPTNRFVRTVGYPRARRKYRLSVSSCC